MQFYFSLLLNLSFAKQASPTVADEANQIYSEVLSPEILDQQLSLLEHGIDVQFRTWVGGDKDGHPYVNAKTMKMSWHKARIKFIHYIDNKINQSLKLLQHLEHKNLHKASDRMHRALNNLKQIKRHDHKRIKTFQRHFLKVCVLCEKLIKTTPVHYQQIKLLLDRYPALVVPLELREDATLVKRAHANKTGAIFTMLKTLHSICGRSDPSYYVKGFVLSMTQTAADIDAGFKLAEQFFKPVRFPIVPLFETERALEQSVQILSDLFTAHPQYKKHANKYFASTFEIMLGYSDSSKESGVLLSRLLIAKAMRDIDEYLASQLLSPIFFHGSGGSIERGGGSVQEQISWWPQTAREHYKATVQGEMVTRNFGNEQIMRGHVEKIHAFSATERSSCELEDEVLQRFSHLVASEYKALIHDPNIQQMIRQATPYGFLDQLRIGSRPTKRSQGTEQFKIRAIPWVLCWTQTRMLIPSWWGIGSAWEALSSTEKNQLKRLAKISPLFESYLKSLGFTLAKIEIVIFKLYLERTFSETEANEYYDYFHAELIRTQQFYFEIQKHDHYLGFKPWLQASIDLRAPMVHPLNLIQIIAMKRRAMELIRETTTGIASGMLTTG